MAAKKQEGRFKSEYFKTADDLVQAKDDAWKPVARKRRRLLVVRQFTNMLSTLTEAEAEELGRTEVTNFGLTYREMAQNEAMYSSMVTGTNALLEVKVETGNLEFDTNAAQRINNAINRHALHYKGKFANFFKKCGGEMTIAGGGPVVQEPKHGWLPDMRPDMFFPRECSLNADEVPYAFDAKELTVAGLNEILASVKDGEETDVERKNVQYLLDSLKEQIKQHTPPTTSRSSAERSRSVRDDDWDGSTASISAWYYYEVKYDDKKKTQYVSSTLFTDGDVWLDGKKVPRPAKLADGSAAILTYRERAYESPTDWLHFIYADSEIGGVKNMDTIRGIAELMFPAGVEIAELLNLTLEGDKWRAKPFFSVSDDANLDEVAKWNETLSIFAPKGLTPVDMGGSAQHLLTPFSILKGVAAGLAASGVSNTERGGELRVQALERQVGDAAILANKTSDAYNHLDCILETIVWRLLCGPTKPGTPGHLDTMAVREELERHGIDYKALGARRNGRFQWMRVRARRIAGAGSRDSQKGIAESIWKNLVNIPPGNRPLAINTAITLESGDPDLADALSQVPQAVINAQKLTAENERDTIRFRAPLGQEIPVGVDDIHQDHIPVHLRDMQAFIARDGFLPWDKLAMLEFTGLAIHTQAHLQILLSNPMTNPEAKVFMRDFQKLVQASQAIAQRVEEQEGSEKQQLTAKEQADMEIKWAKLQIEAAKVGLKTEDMKHLWEQRESRERLMQRKQFTSEVQADKRFKLDATKTAADIVAKKKAANKPAAKKK